MDNGGVFLPVPAHPTINLLYPLRICQTNMELIPTTISPKCQFRVVLQSITGAWSILFSTLPGLQTLPEKQSTKPHLGDIQVIAIRMSRSNAIWNQLGIMMHSFSSLLLCIPPQWAHQELSKFVMHAKLQSIYFHFPRMSEKRIGHGSEQARAGHEKEQLRRQRGVAGGRSRIRDAFREGG